MVQGVFCREKSQRVSVIKMTPEFCQENILPATRFAEFMLLHFPNRSVRTVHTRVSLVKKSPMNV